MLHPRDYIFVVHLKPHHDRSGKTLTDVFRETGLSEQTIRRYVAAEYVHMKQLDVRVLLLCDYYGVDWHTVVLVRKSDDTPESETPSAAA